MSTKQINNQLQFKTVNNYWANYLEFKAFVVIIDTHYTQPILGIPTVIF